jgi:hypothetical protein
MKREEAKRCFWVCIHTYCTRQRIGDDAVAALRANSAFVIDEADMKTDMKTDTTISVSSSHAQLKNPFLYHCDWTSGICWTDPVLQAVAGSEISIEEIPDTQPRSVARCVVRMNRSAAWSVMSMRMSTRTSTLGRLMLLTADLSATGNACLASVGPSVFRQWLSAPPMPMPMSMPMPMPLWDCPLSDAAGSATSVSAMHAAFHQPKERGPRSAVHYLHPVMNAVTTTSAGLSVPVHR